MDAILVAGLPGQEGGHAVAAALLGTIEPAGRPVTSLPAVDGAATVQVASAASATVEVTTDARLWRRWDTEAGS